MFTNRFYQNWVVSVCLTCAIETRCVGTDISTEFRLFDVADDNRRAPADMYEYATIAKETIYLYVFFYSSPKRKGKLGQSFPSHTAEHFGLVGPLPTLFISCWWIIFFLCSSCFPFIIAFSRRGYWCQRYGNEINWHHLFAYKVGAVCGSNA